MKIIDFRLRPPYRSFLNSFLFEEDRLINRGQVVGFEPSQAAVQKDMDLLIQEMNEAGVTYGVTPIRKSTNGDNDDIRHLQNDYPNRFFGFIDVNPLQPKEALRDINIYIINGPAYGITLDPGMETTPDKYYINDIRIYPVLEVCEKNNIPILLTWGGTVSNPKWYNASRLFDTAKTFPNLKMILGHGGFPFITETIQVVWQFKNLYLCPDSFMYSQYPASNIYIEAANYMLQDHIVFGTVYPSFSLKFAVDDILSRLKPEVQEKVMYLNAAHILGIEK